MSEGGWKRRGGFGAGGRRGQVGELGGDSSVSYASTGRSSSVSGEVEWLVPANHAAAAVGKMGRRRKREK